MLQLTFGRRRGNCEGSSRRDFLKVGALGGSALALPDLLRARSHAASQGRPVKNTSVVWLWLAGGPTHVETFDPKMTAPVEYRSVTGECPTPLPGVTLGGTFPEMAARADKMALVRSFAHRNSGHQGGTHWVMTGYDNRQADNGGVPGRPSIGSILSRRRGANHPVTGAPTDVRLRRVVADGPAFLGPAYAPFDQNGQARKNMSMSVPSERLENRRELLGALDTLNRDVDYGGLVGGMDQFEQQSFDLVFGSAAEAFDLKQEDPKLVEKYGRRLGEQLLTARRLCEAGVGFVTIHYGGWDMHGNIEQSLKRRAPELDQAVGEFLDDIEDRGLTDDVLLVITGEFGRTPRVNRRAGRDHWAPLSTLALAGGGLRMGQVVGESAPKVDVPQTSPVSPQDLMATVFHVLGIEQDLQYVSPSGRPVYMIEDGKPIEELI
ncbi:MAG: DUF1501 domain-containing protein [Planctomycetes bacterium]|nr:DUF1501 domain-containing protein [Planctomycetota bacterium]